VDSFPAKKHRAATIVDNLLKENAVSINRVLAVDKNAHKTFPRLRVWYSLAHIARKIQRFYQPTLGD